MCIRDSCEPVDVHIYRDSIQTQERHAMDLLIFKEGGALDVVLARQAVEVVPVSYTHLAIIGRMVGMVLYTARCRRVAPSSRALS